MFLFDFLSAPSKRLGDQAKEPAASRKLSPSFAPGVTRARSGMPWTVCVGVSGGGSFFLKHNPAGNRKS